VSDASGEKARVHGASPSNGRTKNVGERPKNGVKDMETGTVAENIINDIANDNIVAWSGNEGESY